MKIIKAAALGVLAIFALTGPAPALSGESPAVQDAPAPNTVLFLGNSFVYANGGVHNHLRKLTRSIILEPSGGYFFQSKSIAGARLSAHLAGADAALNVRHRKKNGPWDLVVLQGQSQEPIYAKAAGGFKNAARQLDEKIRDSGSQTAFFMTWAYKNRPAMAAPLRDAYTRIGNELDALVVPVGVAFALARRSDPNMQLYAGDKRHPSLLGTYLAANVFFAALYGESPEGASYTAGLGARQAQFAQSIAWQAVRYYFGN